MLIDTDNLSFLISVIFDMRNSDLLTSLIQLFVFNVYEKQAEKLLFSLIDLYKFEGTFYFSLMNEFSILPMNCSAMIDLSWILMLDRLKSEL
jgi:hypothetical protein